MWTRLACAGLLAAALPAQESESSVLQVEEDPAFMVSFDEGGMPIMGFLQLAALVTQKQFRIAETARKPEVERMGVVFASSPMRVRRTDFVTFCRVMVYLNGLGSSVEGDGDVVLAPLRRGPWIGFQRAGRYAALEDLDQEAAHPEGPLLVALPVKAVTAEQAVGFLWPWTHGASSDRSLDGLRAGAAGKSLLVLQGAPGQVIAARTMVELFEARCARPPQAVPVPAVSSEGGDEVVLAAGDLLSLERFLEKVTSLTEKAFVFSPAAAKRGHGVVALQAKARIPRAWLLPYVRTVLFAAGYQTRRSEDGGRIELVPLVKVLNRPPPPAFDSTKPWVAPSNLGASSDEEVLTAVPLRRLVAAEARRVLDPVLAGPLGRHWGGTPKLGLAGSDLLVLQGSPAHLAALCRALERLDAAPAGPAETRLAVEYLRHTAAADIARQLGALHDSAAPEPPARPPAAVVPIAGRAALVLVGSHEQIAAARAEITRLDVVPKSPRGR